MQKYQQFRPTALDSHINLDNRENWLVLSFTQNRDSECLDRSNFLQALEALGGESGSVEVHRFGHWANGWFELILIDPNCESTVKIAYELERWIENYPVLNDEHFSELEHEELIENWNSWQCREFAEFLAGEFLTQEASREALVHEVSRDELFELFNNRTSDTCSTRYNAREYSREDVAKLLIDYRKAK